jgi:hypothetical protein
MDWHDRYCALLDRSDLTWLTDAADSYSLGLPPTAVFQDWRYATAADFFISVRY